jgi:hypothetical protein
VTVVHWALLQQYKTEHYSSHQVAAVNWRTFCRDAFVEENVSFLVDDNCLVRPVVDQEFSTNIVSLIRGLDDPRLAAVRAEVERSLRALGGTEPDPKTSVRSIFEAIEIYAKLVVKTCKVQRLNRSIVVDHLLPLIKASRNYDQPSVDSAEHLANALVDWLGACHVYRHGQGVNEPAPPSPELAIALVGSGATYLRWLLDGSSSQLA